jgi:prevent-host-death family protein
MLTYAARDLIKKYGSIADRVSAGEPVCVTKHGRTAFYMVPPSFNIEELLEQAAVARFLNIMKEAKPTAAATALSDEALTDLLDANS